MVRASTGRLSQCIDGGSAMIIKRRTVIAAAVVSPVALSTVPANAIWVAPVVRFVTRFLFNVGAGVVANSIYEAIRDPEIPADQRQALGDASDIMRPAFPDTSDSEVYQTDESTMFTQQNPENDSCMAIINNEDADIAGFTEGPTNVILGNVSQDFRNNRVSTAETRQQLLPRKFDQLADGGFQTGYRQPEIFETERNFGVADFFWSGGRAIAQLSLTDRQTGQVQQYQNDLTNFYNWG